MALYDHVVNMYHTQGNQLYSTKSQNPDEIEREILNVARSDVRRMMQEYPGSSTQSEEAEKWYYDQIDSQCVKDCIRGGPACRGPPSDISASRYPTSAECCNAEMIWATPDFCGTVPSDEYTNKYYADYENGKCTKHCALNEGGPCGGHPSDLSLAAYDNAESCCKTELFWLNKFICAAEASNTIPTGSGLYYVDWVGLQCLRECSDPNDAECGGVADINETPRMNDGEFYETKELCCSLQLPFVSDCVAKNSPTSLDQWYYDRINSQCHQQNVAMLK
ncbi:hypothetical protein ACHAXS_005065 [Conticribra weissflogii]